MIKKTLIGCKICNINQKINLSIGTRNQVQPLSTNQTTRMIRLFIAEKTSLTRMINAWVYDTPIKDIALKALHVMPALLLQKPGKNSKSKEHPNSL